MKILLWNVNGIRAAFRQNLAQLFDERYADVICLQEVKAWPEQLLPEQLNPAGYQSEFSCAQKKGYSGVSTFVHPEIKYRNVTKGLGEERFDQEGRILKISLKDFDLYNIYFPSGTSGELRQKYKYEFLNYIYDYFSALSSEARANSILCGDFNICHREIDIHHPKQAELLQLSGFLPEERAWMSRFLELGFYDAFRQLHGDVPSQYTWWSYRAGARGKNLGWRIDYFTCGENIRARLKSCQIRTELSGSDHAPVLIEVC
jgi:exodeoxyribonuclease III